jgi:hypothetical protein
MFKKISKLLELHILKLLKEIEQIDKINTLDSWNLETGKKFNNIINNYPIDEEELLSICETVAKFVSITRYTNIDKYLFLDDKLTEPRLPFMLERKI